MDVEQLRDMMRRYAEQQDNLHQSFLRGFALGMLLGMLVGALLVLVMVVT